MAKNESIVALLKEVERLHGDLRVSTAARNDKEEESRIVLSMALETERRLRDALGDFIVTTDLICRLNKRWKDNWKEMLGKCKICAGRVARKKAQAKRSGRVGG